MKIRIKLEPGDIDKPWPQLIKDLANRSAERFVELGIINSKEQVEQALDLEAQIMKVMQKSAAEREHACTEKQEEKGRTS